MRYIYSLFFYLLLPFLPLRLLWRGRKNPDYRLRWGERFGFYENQSRLTNSIWIHAVSVGEAIAALPLVKELKIKYPTLPIVFTTMTPTGRERVQKALGDQVLQLYVPYDYPQAVKRFLNHIQPKLVLILETELWPNILHYCAQRKIPTYLINARIADKSFRGYYKIRFFVRKMLACFTLIMAQSKKDYEYLIKLGANPKHLQMLGNIKFDITIADEILEQGKQLRQQLGAERPILIAASTHQGEEEKILVAFKKILATTPSALLIIAPRHPERFDEVASLCQQTGFNVVRYSREEKCAANTNIFVADVMGKLLSFYAASDLAFVGGSLVPVGGHNLLEPAALGIPVISGQYLGNFTEISQLLNSANALFTVKDENEFAEKALLLLQNKELCQQYGNAAKNVVEQNKGVLQNILSIIEQEIQR